MNLRHLGWSSLSLRVLFLTITLIAMIFLVAPSAIVLLTSFSNSESLRFPPTGFSLRWYAELLDADQMQRAAWTSLIVAAWTTLIAVVLGTAASIGIARTQSAWARAADLLFLSPLLLPALAFGFAAMLFVYRVGLRPNLTVLILGHVVVCVPFVMRTTLAALSQLDPNLLDASRSLGASAWLGFRRVTLPLIGRGVGAGAFLAFMSSFDNVPVSLFLADERTEVLPIHLWQQIEANLDIRTAAAAGLIVLATLALMILAETRLGLTRQLT